MKYINQINFLLIAGAVVIVGYTFSITVFQHSDAAELAIQRRPAPEVRSLPPRSGATPRAAEPLDPVGPFRESPGEADPDSAEPLMMPPSSGREADSGLINPVSDPAAGNVTPIRREEGPRILQTPPQTGPAGAASGTPAFSAPVIEPSQSDADSVEEGISRIRTRNPFVNPPNEGAGAEKRGAGTDPPPPPVRSSMPDQRPPR